MFSAASLLGRGPEAHPRLLRCAGGATAPSPAALSCAPPPTASAAGAYLARGSPAPGAEASTPSLSQHLFTLALRGQARPRVALEVEAAAPPAAPGGGAAAPPRAAKAPQRPPPPASRPLGSTKRGRSGAEEPLALYPGSHPRPLVGPTSVTALFLQTQALVVRCRSAKEALRHTDLRTVLQRMHPEDMGRAALALTRTLGMTAARKSALSQWEKFFASKGLPAEYPLSLLSVLGFILNYAAVKGNASHVLKGAVSNLRRAAQLNDIWDIDAEGEVTITSVTKATKAALPSKPKESEAVDIDSLQVMLTGLDLEGSPASVRLGAMTATATNFKMRGTEVYGERGIRRGDVTLLPEGVIYESVLCKTGLGSLQPRPRAAPHLIEECALLCETYWLKRYLEVVDPKGTMPLDNPLFCPLDAKGRWTTGVPIADVEDAAIKACMEEWDIPTAGLNLEWGRHTGELLHIFKCGLEQPTSDLLGDHASKSSVSVTHYVHPAGQGGNILTVGATKIKNYASGKICCR